MTTNGDQHVRAQRDRRRRTGSCASIRSTSSGTSSRSSTRASSRSRISTSRLRSSLVVFVALRFVNQSRTGRAWRSLREDPLAAEVMGMPVNWLKLLSFAFGAAVAALTGTLFASLNASVFPLSFFFVAADHRLHDGHPGRRRATRPASCSARRDQRPAARDAARPGQGARRSSRRADRRPRRSRSGARASSRSSWRRRSCFGFVVHAIAGAINHVVGRRREGAAASPALVDHWVVVPAELARWIPPVSYIGLIAMALVLTLVTAGCG